MKNRLFKGILLSWVLCSLMVVSGCLHCIGYCGPTVRHERTVQLSKPMATDSLFVAKSRDGWITVNGGDTTDCTITATIIAQAHSEEDAIKIAEQANVKLDQVGHRLTVKLEKPILVRNQSVDIQLKATVPGSCDVELATDDGDITVKHVNGKIDIKTDDGGVNLSHITGNISVRGNDGSIDIHNVNRDVTLQRENGTIDIETDDGTITLSGIKSNLKVRNNDGSVTARDIIGDIDVQTDDGTITVVCSEDANRICDVSLVTNDAPIEFTAPANFSARVEINTNDGSIHSDLPIKVTGKIGKSGLKGTIGTGDGNLYIKTDDGSIRIR
jgi:hypothetical protein